MEEVSLTLRLDDVEVEELMQESTSFPEKNVGFQIAQTRMYLNWNCINEAEMEIYVQKVCTELRNVQIVRKTAFNQNIWPCGPKNV